MGRRGKLKYRDVVKKPKQSLKAPKKVKQRKTYSLYVNKNKRKPNFSEGSNAKKKMTIEQPVPIPIPKNDPIEESSDSSEEESDYIKLLKSFNPKAFEKRKKAIESDSESEEESVDEKPSVKRRWLESLTENDCDINSGVPEGQINSDEEIRFDNEVQDDTVDINNDPFVKHLSYDLHDNMLHSLKNIPGNWVNTSTTNTYFTQYRENWPVLGHLLIKIPKCEIVDDEKENYSILEKKTYASEGTVPSKITKSSNLYIKPQIRSNASKVNKAITGAERLTAFQSELFSIINNYQDFLYQERTFSNSEELRFVYCLHAVNHILKTRTKIEHHNAKLSKTDDIPDDYRDQGLVRPKVLIIVPFKNSAYKIVRMIIDLLLPEDKGNVMHKLRFIEDYTGNELIMSKKNPKPDDYQQTFQGNISEDFKIGMKVTKKSLKLYTDFYSSDIIIASPLGLRTTIGAEGEPDRDYDFLASIELLILDQTEIFLMQNWHHLRHVFKHLHLQLKDSHGTNFFRARTWCVNGWSKYYRQTLIFSSVMVSYFTILLNKYCWNYSGRVQVVNLPEFGCIRDIYVKVPHYFHNIGSECNEKVIEDRFNFFLSKILPRHTDEVMKQTMIFISSYYSYVKIRNYFKEKDIGFVQICEYSKEAEVAGARDMFFHGAAHFLLYTERFHFYNRKMIKGIRHLIFYELPVFPHFYEELCDLMEEAKQNRKVGSSLNISVTVIYSKFDLPQLCTIVGEDKAVEMIHSDRKVHMITK